MHPVTVFHRQTDGDGLAFQPPVEWQICRDTLALDRTLEGYLVAQHTPLGVPTNSQPFTSEVERGWFRSKTVACRLR